MEYIVHMYYVRYMCFFVLSIVSLGGLLEREMQHGTLLSVPCVESAPVIPDDPQSSFRAQ
jgi:hypothetical protein